jgi:hypothetical protein
MIMLKMKYGMGVSDSLICLYHPSWASKKTNNIACVYKNVFSQLCQTLLHLQNVFLESF